MVTLIKKTMARAKPQADNPLPMPSFADYRGSLAIDARVPKGPMHYFKVNEGTATGFDRAHPVEEGSYLCEAGGHVYRVRSVEREQSSRFRASVEFVGHESWFDGYPPEPKSIWPRINVSELVERTRGAKLMAVYHAEG